MKDKFELSIKYESSSYCSNHTMAFGDSIDECITNLVLAIKHDIHEYEIENKASTKIGKKFYDECAKFVKKMEKLESIEKIKKEIEKLEEK